MAASKQIETNFGYCEIGHDKGFFSSNERKWITHIKKLAKEHPNECVIIKNPEQNNGFICAKMPTSWLYVRPPKTREMTEEQRMAAAERLRQAREAKKGD